MKLLLPEPQGKNYSAIINDIEAGRIKIPQFQREFVWTKDKSRHLLDSIIKGYPIGTFIIWKTRERLRSVRNIGDAELPEPPKGDHVHYVLDGQQRLTSLFASLQGLTVQRDGKEVDFSKMYVDLKVAENDENEQIVIINIDEYRPDEYIQLKSLIKPNFVEIAKNYSSGSIEKIQKYSQQILGYNFSTIFISDAPISIATEIFTRINEGGKRLTVFEIMVAKMFDSSKDFDLSEKWDALTERLERVGYETVSRIRLLQLMAVLLNRNRECKTEAILDLKKEKFIEKWDAAVEAFEEAVEYFRNHLHIPVSRLLPYDALLVPFAYFFYRYENKKPTGDIQRYLADFFWRASLSQRYSRSLETKLTQDIKRIDDILAGKEPEYDFPVDYSASSIKRMGMSFRASSGYDKALLCLLAYFGPKSFNNNSKVTIGNDWLKQVNSKNYHHFFPRSYLKKRGIADEEANHTANITIVDDYLNKREIGAKPPSEYMKKFSKENDKIRDTMKTHLIDADSESIQNDNYDEFIEERCRWFSKELKKRIIPREIDKEPVAHPDIDDEESDDGDMDD